METKEEKTAIMQKAMKSLNNWQASKPDKGPFVTYYAEKKLKVFKFSSTVALKIANTRAKDLGYTFVASQIANYGTKRIELSNNNDKDSEIAIKILLYPFNGVFEVDHKRLSNDDDQLRYLIAYEHLHKYGNAYRQAYIGHCYYLHDQEIQNSGKYKRADEELYKRLQTIFKASSDIKMEE